MEGDLIAHINQRGCLVISIHSLRMEGDVERSCTQSREVHFNPLPPHGGRRTDTWQSHAASAISIHSLRMEGDAIVSLHTEGDYFSNAPCAPPQAFQSTPSAWRETLSFVTNPFLTYYFNPLPPHGGRPRFLSQLSFPAHFNPLPPHGGRLAPSRTCGTLVAFQSTPSAWRETFAFHQHSGIRIISIHSLRMEGD